MRVFPLLDIVELDTRQCHSRDLIIKLLNLNIDMMEQFSKRMCVMPVASLQLADACFMATQNNHDKC